MSNEYSSIRYWVNDLPKKGKSSFALSEVRNAFPSYSNSRISNAIYRLSQNSIIRSVWAGYYAIILPEYGINGVAPPIEYVDGLMRHIRVKYYVGLLSAASYHGAAHQQPQVFQVVADKELRAKSASGIKMEFAYRKLIDDHNVVARTVNSGTVRISSPEQTAVDLLVYHNRCGGMSNVGTVISELADIMDFRKLSPDFMKGVSIPAIQRLGFILQHICDESEMSDELYELAMGADMLFRKNQLSPSNDEISSGDYDNRWKINQNIEIEVDI